MPMISVCCKKMKITVLIEDSSSRPGIAAEHGLSLYLETKKHRLLLDTGASALTLQNADALGVDLTSVDTVVISHGHYDHAGGLLSFAERNPDAEIYLNAGADGAFYHGEKYIGIDRKILNLPHLNPVSAPAYEIDGELTLFSAIGGRRLWPGGNLELTEEKDGVRVQDRFSHEQCLIVREGEKTLLASGCAHNGILNILDRYRELTGGYPDAVVSGFHMIKKTGYDEADLAAIRQTADELKDLPTVFYSGHCTGDLPFSVMKEILGEKLMKISAGDGFTV